MNGQTYRHVVVFNLKHSPDSPEERRFLADGERILTGIPTVQNFEVLRQVSPKSDYAFGFSMEFEDTDAFDQYNNHPDHLGFVRERWEAEVASFMEVDFQKL